MTYLILFGLGICQTVPALENSTSFLTKEAHKFTDEPGIHDFGNDVPITNIYRPHYAPDIASDYSTGEAFCSFNGRSNSLDAIFVFKTTDGGKHWVEFAAVYATSGSEHLAGHSIAVTQNYICVVYTIDIQGGYGTIKSYRVPRTGGSGISNSLPPSPCGYPDITSYEGTYYCGDTIQLAMVYEYDYPNEGAITYYRSTNGGATWGYEYTFELNTQPRPPTISHSPGWIYITWGETTNSALKFARSSNSGANFQTQVILNNWCLCTETGLCSGGGSVYVFTHGGIPVAGKILRSTNYGNSWQTGDMLYHFDLCSAQYVDYAYVAGIVQSSTPDLVRCQKGTQISDFISTWLRIDDPPSDLLKCLTLCTDSHSDAIVAWVEYIGGGQILCDGWNWTGIDEDKISIVEKGLCGPTIFCGSLHLPVDRICRVFDIRGAIVTPSKIKPGIYFIEVDGKIVQKVIKAQ